jgi:hypothetical protein
MRNFSEKNVGKCPHKGWRIVEDDTVVSRSSGLGGVRGSPDCPQTRTTDGKLGGVGSKLNFSSQC